MSFSSCRSLVRTVVGALAAGLLAPALAGAVLAETPWAAGVVDAEIGLLRQVRHNTPINYTLVPTQLSWRSSPVFNHVWADGSRLIVRHRLTLIGTWVKKGPESHYVGFSGSPSIEWWNRGGTQAVVGGAGGGFGWIDSREVPGGQGQDFTLNWFARAGVERVLNPRARLLAGVMFQHMSNGGMTKPNPGVDALGFTLGCSWSY